MMQFSKFIMTEWGIMLSKFYSYSTRQRKEVISDYTRYVELFTRW